MAEALRDHRSRPVVAVTGIGVVTSLGVGLADNWKAVTAGRSGIHRIKRFPLTHLRTPTAGTIDYLPVEPKGLALAAGELAGDEAVVMSGLGKPGDFPGPLFLALPPAQQGGKERRGGFEASHPNGGDVY